MSELSDDQAIEKFRYLDEGWLMQFDAGWWAFYGEEPPIGPFDTKAEASRAGLGAWGSTEGNAILD
jgi:hypothetical protein